MNDDYMDYLEKKFEQLLNIDSTTGLYSEIQNYIINEIRSFGYCISKIHKGGVIVDLGGEGNPLYVMGHCDTIGLQVRYINPDGTLKVVAVGDLPEHSAIGENVRIHTLDGKVYTGTVQLVYSSEHIKPIKKRRNYACYEKDLVVVLDEIIKSADEVRHLGILEGDWIALNHRFEKTNSGYIKSRFIDDKLNVAIMLTVMKELKELKVNLNRNVKFGFTMYEETGHGGSFIPENTKDILALDVACVGPENTSDELKVSIFAKETRFSYHRDIIRELVEIAKIKKLDFVVDVFTPTYGTDCEDTIIAGYDVRHGAIGPGTLATHGYERTHKNAVKNTYILLKSYIVK